MRTYTVTEYEKEDYDNFINSLNNEKAVALLERIDAGWIGGYSFTGEEDDFDRFTLHKALQYAMDKLENGVKNS